MQAIWRVLAIVVVASCGAFAAAAPPPASGQAEVKGVIDAFFAAAIRRDWDAAGSLLSADFKIYVDGLEIYDRPEYIALLKADDLKTLSLDLTDLDIAVSSDGGMAWARYRTLIDSESRGVRSKTRTAETLIFGREDGAWRIRHGHVSLASEKVEAP